MTIKIQQFKTNEMQQKQFQEEILQHYKLTSGDKKNLKQTTLHPKELGCKEERRTNKTQSLKKERNHKN